MRILLCDDSEAFLSQFSSALSLKFARRDIAIDLTRCTSGAQLLAEIDQNPADAVFLDIEMPGEDGFAVAARLSARPQPPLLLFTTSMDDLVYESFAYQPFWFLRKGHLEELPLVVDKLIAATLQKSQGLSIAIEGLTRRFLPEDILYFESRGHYLLLHPAKEEKPIRFKAKMDFVMSKLPAPDFVRCHESYYVNCRYIKTLDKKNLTLRDGTSIPVSRSRWQQTQDAFFRGKGSIKR